MKYIISWDRKPGENLGCGMVGSLTRSGYQDEGPSYFLISLSCHQHHQLHAKVVPFVAIQLPLWTSGQQASLFTAGRGRKILFRQPRNRNPALLAGERNLGVAAREQGQPPDTCHRPTGPSLASSVSPWQDGLAYHDWFRLVGASSPNHIATIKWWGCGIDVGSQPPPQ